MQIYGLRRQFQSAFDSGDGFVKASGLDELAGEFLEGRQNWWSACRSMAQLFNRFGLASGATQRCPQQNFNFRIAVASGCLFKGGDGFSTPILSEQGSSQYSYGCGVRPVTSQDFSGELFCVGGLSRSQRKGSAFDRLRAGLLVSGAD